MEAGQSGAGALPQEVALQADAYADIPLPIDPSALAALIGGTTAGVGILDTKLRYLYVNPALERLNGIPAAEHLGRTVADVLPEIDAREDMMLAVLSDGMSREITSSGRTPAATGADRRYWHGTYHRLEVAGQVVGVAGIVLEVMASDEEQRRLDRTRHHLSLLDAANTRIGTTLDMDTTCAELVDLVVPGLADFATVEVFPPDVAPPVRPAPPGVFRMRRAAQTAVPGLLERFARFGVAGDYIDHQPGSAVPRCLATNQLVVENLTDDEQLGRVAPSPNGSPSTGLSGCTRRSSCRSPFAAGRSASSAWSGPGARRRSRPRTWWSPGSSPRGPPSISTTRAASPTSTPSPWSCSARCSPNRVRRIRTSRSPPAICRPTGRCWWAATGSMSSRCVTGTI